MMKYFRRFASIPNHLAKVNFDNNIGFWVYHASGNYFFIFENGIVYVPKSLRGKKSHELTVIDFENLPEHEKGNPDYTSWLDSFKKEKEVEKLYNNHDFTDKGKTLVQRLQKFFIKNKFHALENYQLDKEYSFDLTYFDKLLAQNSQDRVKFYGRRIARKYRTIIEMLREINKDVDKIEQDFYYHWNKLSPIFDFDPQSFGGDEDIIEESKGNNFKNKVEILVNDTINFINPQMIEIKKFLNKLYKFSKKEDLKNGIKAFNDLKDILNKYKNDYTHHDIGKNADKILTLKSFVDLENIVL